MSVRIFIFTALCGVVYGVLGLRLYELQIEKADYYFKKVQARDELRKELELRRGKIFFTDRSGNAIPVAFNQDYPVVYAVPREIEKTAFEQISAVTGENQEKLEELYQRNPRSLFMAVVEKASQELVDKVTKAAIPGLYVTAKQYRFYPSEKLAAQVLGFVGVNKEYNVPVGLYGIEKKHNSTLAEGEDVYLTIDRNIQVEAEIILEALVREFEATGGSIMVQEPQTGKIIALANAPDFNPNTYSAFSVDRFLNPAIQHIYEPGSVFKPMTLAAGLDSGKLSIDTTFFDKGSITMNGKTITNWDEKAHGTITLANILESSINVGAVLAGQKIGNTTLYEYIKKFGFGRKTNVNLPDEVSGSLKNLENKKARPIDFATAAFGQGTAVTPLQLISAFSSIANGGTLMQPLIEAREEPYIVRRVISKETATTVTAMMESAVEKAHVASMARYRIAGKTGTAQIPNPKGRGYLDAFIHSYVGFAPASNPRFTALIKINQPHALLAGTTVVPAFKELAQFIINYYNIPPDKEIIAQ